MKKDELERLTGFRSFTECFNWLKREKKDKTRVITCKKEGETKTVFGKPIAIPPETTHIEVSEIKLEALEEIHKALPTREEIEKINQSIDRFLPEWKREEAIALLSKIPTK